MSKREKIKYHLTRFRRVILATSLILIAVAIVGVVAVKGGEKRAMVDDNNDKVIVSAPTTITFIMPISNGTIIKGYSATALKYNSTLEQWESHKAVDIKGQDKANVMAVYDGKVVSINNPYLLGTTVTISHNNTLKTVYASLDEVSVKVGDTVKQGMVIGKASTTAKAESNEGDHLHFEVISNDVKVDPLLYLNTGEK